VKKVLLRGSNRLPGVGCQRLLFYKAFVGEYPLPHVGIAVVPAALRIKAGKYGSAIGLLLRRGGAFQTRHERTLIVDLAQMKALEQAGLIEGVGFSRVSSKANGQKNDAG
jgi:hypothetical protein